MDRTNKQQIVSELQAKLKQAKLGVLTNFNAMNVEKMETLRNVLRKNDAELKVVKNTLLGIASKETDFTVLADYFKFPVAVVLSYKDPVAPTKALIEFARKKSGTGNQGGCTRWQVADQRGRHRVGRVAKPRGSAGQAGFRYGRSSDFAGHRLSGVPRSFVQVLNAYCDKKKTLN